MIKITRTGLNIALESCETFGAGSYNVPVTLKTDGTYADYTTSLKVGWWYRDTEQAKTVKAEANGTFLLPAEALQKEAKIDIAFILENGTYGLVTNQLSVKVVDAPYVGVELKGDSWTDLVDARVDTYLKLTGGVSTEDVESAVNNYLTLHPVSGMTTQEKAQLNQNTEDIEQLKGTIEDLKENGVSGGGTVVSSIEPMEDDIPKVFFDEAIPQTKTDTVTKFRYISKTKDVSGYAEFKAQGNSSLSYPKKNMTVKMYQDEALETKLKVDFKDWGKQSKHVYKANWIDLTHARNVVSARLWGQVVKSRSEYESYPIEFKNSPNQGAIDGFPIKVYSQGIYQGRYTLNIPKDAWTFNMDKDLDNHCILCGENYASGCFRASANINGSDWSDEVHDTVPTSIKTRWNEVISFVMNSSDEEFKANLSNYFYVDSLIDYFIFGMVSCGLDAFGKNQIYATYNGQKWIASMYDMDSTWGLYWNGSKFVGYDYSRESYEDFVNTNGNLLFIRLVNNFTDDLKARALEVLNDVLSVPNIINEFERFTDIAPLDLVKEDYASTTGSGKFTAIPSKDTNNIQQIRKYVVDRHAWSVEYFNGLTSEEPIEPPTEKTLTSISATYSGGDVTVGTELTDLVGNIVVTATYSDETSSTVTGYELSGEIVEGSNTITVSYQGMTTTFTVVGYVEQEEPMIIYSLPQETTFNGTSDYIDTNVKLFDTNKDFTLFVDCASNLDSNKTTTIAHCMKEANPWPGLCIQTQASGSYLQMDCLGQKTSYSNIPPINKDRHKFIVIKNGTNISYYVDTNSPTTKTGTYTQIDNTLLLGAYQDTSGTKGRYWKGTMYDCKVWNRALTDDDIQELLGN